MKEKLLSLALALLLSSLLPAHASAGNIGVDDARSRYAGALGKRSFFFFPETRENPLRWYDSIPAPRISDALSGKDFALRASPGEYFVFQLGVCALKGDVRNLRVAYSPLKEKGGALVPASRITCFNKGGIDFRGRPFSKEVNIRAGRVQSLWFGVDLSGVRPGRYKGSFSLFANGEKQSLPLLLDVGGELLPDHGFNEGSRLSRLAWLNSTVGIDEEITKGYLPVAVKNGTITILGRDLTIAPDGLPARIRSYFTSSNQALSQRGEAVVPRPFRFIIEKEDGASIHLTPGDLKFTKQTRSVAAWQVRSSSRECDLDVTGLMEFDGFLDYHLTLTARSPLRVRDIRMEAPVAPEKAGYMMGLGHEGGYRTPDWKWKWDTTKNQDMVWVGGVTGGIRLKLKAENYTRPLINLYYGFGRLHLPPSWGNENKGGVTIGDAGSDVLINAYSGSRELRAGEVLHYDFELLITPFKTIDRNIKFNDRYYHGGTRKTEAKLDTARRTGANIVNVHHAEDIYPFINYPYLDANVPALRKLVADGHDRGLRVKLYYTTRELTKNLPEFWAFNSLNGEVIFPGPGNASRTEVLHPNGPHPWLIRNLRENYIPAWYNEIQEGPYKGELDLAVITTPDSRLNNFYVAGLDWMVRNLGIDGVYIDDSALDHYTVRRARKIVDRHRPDGRLDLHSWNHFNGWAGFASCLNLYMDMLPCFDHVWIGEGRDYNRAPDHWLIEVSGIPFGVTGQMLAGGGNPWRGMVYGITNRAGWMPVSPEYLWKFFDEYGLSAKRMTGYWEEDCPVTCSDAAVKASVFTGADEHVIAVANWTAEEKTVSLRMDWKKLRMDSTAAEIFIPGIQEFQESRAPVSTGRLVLPGGKGLLVVVRKQGAR